MKTYAKIDNNGVVENILVVSDNKSSSWLTEKFGGNWIESSEEKTKYEAVVGNRYDSELNIFIPTQPYESWSFSKTSLLWEPPVPRPEDLHLYDWEEESVSWKQISKEPAPDAQNEYTYDRENEVWVLAEES